MKTSERLESLVILTGMSGSGKHTAFKAFEDLGYFCVDNLPTSLIPRLIQMSNVSGGKIRKLAVVVDIRLGESPAEFQKFFSKVKELSPQSSIIFVDAENEILARRYSETRRIHPLAQDKSLLEGIRAERRRLAKLKSLADLVIDTSHFSVHDLRNFIYENFRESKREEILNVSIVSFGFKYGLPYNSDLVFDVRFLPNPNFVPDLRSKTGNDPNVVKYLEQCTETQEVLGRFHDMLEYLLPKYTKEGKKYLTISIGCTGGKHRSVVIANKLRSELEKTGREINLIHRDLHNE